VVLVAHSLGCILTAAWAEVSRSTGRVQGALLVAPGDPERDELRGLLPSWAPIVRQRLPFSSTLVGSRNDPYCTFEKAQSLANSWGSRFVDHGERGHINAESGLGDWPEGRALLQELTDKKDN
jgi:predicted alpha/beta hydrolase family esterase